MASFTLQLNGGRELVNAQKAEVMRTLLVVL